MISREEIQNLAELSRLKLTDEEIGALQKDFDSILEYVGQISEVTEAPQGPSFESPELRTVLEAPLLNVMREDEPRGEDDPMAGKAAAMLSQAPKRDGDYIVVRKIIDRDQ